MKVKLSIMFLLVSLNANAVVLGFVTGSDYIKMKTDAQTSWVVGVMDGIMEESISQKPGALEPWLGSCVKRHDWQQLKALFEKELNANPESWHAPAALIYRSTINKFCNGR